MVRTMGVTQFSSLSGTDKTHELHAGLATAWLGILNLGSGCLAWQTNAPGDITLLYDPGLVTVEFFIGGGSTAYSNGDMEHVPRMVADSEFSKAQMKRAHRSPYLSGRYAFEWHGEARPMEVPFPTYLDPLCVLAIIGRDGSSYMRPDGSIVPQLERISNIADIAFVGSVSKPSENKTLTAFLSGLAGENSLATLVARMDGAYALRMERGREVAYKPLNLFR